MNIDSYKQKKTIVYENKSFVLYDVIFFSNLFCFDDEGKVIWRIGDYLNNPVLIMDVVLTKEGQLRVFDAYQRRFDVDIENGTLSNMEVIFK